MQTSKHRLEMYRSKASAIGRTPFSQDWRYWKSNIWSTPNTVRGSEGQIFSDDKEQYGRYLGHSDQVTRMDHTGWYCDGYYADLIKGGVAKLRCPRGTLYIPVTFCTGWESTQHWLKDAVLVAKGATEDDHNEAIKDAARYADRCAEIEAEEAREFSAKDMAERDIEEARTEIHELNKKCLALLKSIRQHGEFDGPVCSALREKVQDYLAERGSKFRLIAKREDNFWTAVPNY